MMPRIRIANLAAGALALAALFAPRSEAQEPTPAAGAAQGAIHGYELEYKFRPGQTLRYQTQHLGTIETKIKGTTQTAQSRSLSRKIWQVRDVSDDQQATFTHTIDDVDMWQRSTGREEIRYQSQKDEKAPPEYQHVAATLGKPLTQVTIDKYGIIHKRENLGGLQLENAAIGLTVPLPAGKVKIGSEWFHDEEAKVQADAGQTAKIKLRKVYRLESVKEGVAELSLKTAIVTPVREARIKAQLAQRIFSGKIEFDLEAGCVISQQLDQDERVIGFAGGDSLMKCRARYTEQLLREETARTPGPTPR